MEKDKQLKEILLHNAESASPDFTHAVMHTINQLPLPTFSYQPLLSSKMTRALVLIFSVLVLAILLLCMVIGSPELPYINWIQTVTFSDRIINKALLYIISFCFVFTVNMLMQKNKIKFNASLLL